MRTRVYSQATKTITAAHNYSRRKKATRKRSKMIHPMLAETLMTLQHFFWPHINGKALLKDETRTRVKLFGRMRGARATVTTRHHCFATMAMKCDASSRVTVPQIPESISIVRWNGIPLH